jgi:hypothetical protein
MIFVDVFATAEAFNAVRATIAEQVAGVLKSTPASISVRRIVSEPAPTDVEIWVELSSDDQLVRHGRAIAEQVAASVRSLTQADVWVMYKVVPLSHAFLNGVPRARGRAAFD